MWVPEAIAVLEMLLNHGLGGVTRRLMSKLGCPFVVQCQNLVAAP